SDETKIRSLRNEEINQLRMVLGRREGKNRRADLYFRLAEIYLEAYHTEFLLEGRAHEKRLEKGIPDKFIDRTHSRPYISAGIKACQEVIGFRIPFEKLDQVYYFLAFYYGELDDRKQSAAYYQHLAKTYPNSVFAGVANKELGDYYYSQSQFQPAAGHFEIALRKIDPDNTPPVLHKLAWCYYRMKGYDRAISTMKDAIAKAMQVKKYGPMKDEALRDMATLMTERGRVEEAIQYFQSVAGDEKFFPGILEKLGRQYERNVESDKAIHVYESLLKTHPDTEAAFRVMVKLVELDIKTGRFMEALQRLRAVPPQTGGDQETQVAAQNLKVLIRKTGTEHHQLYRKKNSSKDLEIAEAYYIAYSEHYLKKEDAHQELPEIQMYLAEVKRDLKKFREATELYRVILKSGDKRYAKEAGALWRDSLIEVMKKEPARAGAVAPSGIEKEFIEASDLLQKNLSETADGQKQVKEMALRSTLVLAGYSQTKPEAVTRIKEILSKWPSSPQALTAAQLLLQMELEQPGNQKNSVSPELLSLVKELNANTELMTADRNTQKGKLAAALEQQYTKVKVGRIGQFEKEKDYLSAAKEYEVIAGEIPQRDLAEKAYGNAMSSYLKLEEAGEGILHLATIWRTRFPGSTSANESLRTAATNALIRGKFDLSAKLFEKLGVDFQSAESLEAAARVNEAAGNSLEAQRIWLKFLDTYRNSNQRWAVALSLAQSQDRAHLDAEASRSFKYCAAGPEAFFAECNSRLADLYMKNKDVQQAKTLYRTVAGVAPSSAPNSNNGKLSGKSKGKASKGKLPLKSEGLSRGKLVSSPFVGYARFKIADLMQSEATFEPMRLPEAQLQKGLGQRLNFLEPLSKAYQSVVEVGGPWAIAALDKLATWAYQFADDVDAIAPPPNAKPASIEKFHKDLASVSQPLREKARSTWNDAYVKATQVDLFSPALPSVADHLADFGMTVPGRAQGPRGKLQLAGMAPELENSAKTEALLAGVRDRLMKNVQDPVAWTDYGNLMWGKGKPLMARMFYERALALNPKSTVALNNMGVIKIQSEGEEDWVAVSEGARFFSQALQFDDFYAPAKMNLATLMNYYRMFPRAKALWEQVLVRSSLVDANDGAGVATQGMGNTNESLSYLKKASDMGAPSRRFTWVYQEAARASLKKKDGANDCLSILDRLDLASLEGFEKYSVEYLKGRCEIWKKLN
ncbi:MAG: tetratricopeptide repeat protein, partial [Bdellovibrionia bacterium]